VPAEQAALEEARWSQWWWLSWWQWLAPQDLQAHPQEVEQERYISTADHTGKPAAHDPCRRLNTMSQPIRGETDSSLRRIISRLDCKLKIECEGVQNERSLPLPADR
jgi:hypothetical protein